MKLKHTVSVRGTGAEMVMAAMVVESVWWEVQDDWVEEGEEHDLVITSGVDSYHSYGSKHWSGDALDFRTKTLPRGVVNEFEERVRVSLGTDFDVVLEDLNGENEHLHVEFHPKRRN